MVDFGLVALILLNLIIAGASAWLFLATKSEVRALKDLGGKNAALETLVADVKVQVNQLEMDHYKTLAKRIDTLSDGLADVRREVDRFNERALSLQGKIGQLKKAEKALENQAPDGGAEHPQNFFAPPSPAVPAKNPTFGRKAA